VGDEVRGAHGISKTNIRARNWQTVNQDIFEIQPDGLIMNVLDYEKELKAYSP
jgi:predicted ABC-type ATPase